MNRREEREKWYEEVRQEVLGMAKVKETDVRQDERMVTNYECKAALHGEDDAVNRPAHYRGKTLECIDVIHDFDLNYDLGNAVKYILRSGKKGDRITDLKKAVWYLQREIGNE